MLVYSQALLYVDAGPQVIRMMAPRAVWAEAFNAVEFKCIAVSRLRLWMRKHEFHF